MFRRSRQLSEAHESNPFMLSNLNINIKMEPKLKRLRLDDGDCGDFRKNTLTRLSNNMNLRPQSRYRITQKDIGYEFQWCLDLEGAKGIEKFAKKYPGQFYYNGLKFFQAWQLTHTEQDRPNIQVEWIYGRGPDKNKFAFEKYPNAYVKDPTNKWWENYMFQRECIIQQLDTSTINIGHLLRWFDKYRMTVETKGSSLPLHVDKFIITSNFAPFDVYGRCGVLYSELASKIHNIQIINSE